MILDHEHQRICPYQVCLDLVVSTKAALFIRSQELEENQCLRLAVTHLFPAALPVMLLFAAVGDQRTPYQANQ